MASPDGRLAASTALTTGYDFMSDGATSIDAALPTPTAAKQTLISDNWSGSDLTERLFGAGSSAEVQSLNAHFDHHQLLPTAGNAGGADALVTTADLAANQGRMAGRLVFSMGCHSGLSVPDGYLTGSATTTDEMVDPAPLPGETPAQTRARAARLDWAEAFANDGAVYIGNTGYGYGDTSAVAFSEHLMVRLASLLDGSVTAGQALSYAKQAYFGSLAAYSDYDQKVLMEATFYGLPFWGVGTSTPLPPTPGGVSTSIDPESGVPASPVSVHPAFTAATTPSGEVLTADGGAPTVLEGQPIVARTTVDATPSDPSLELHGFVITDLESSDTSGVRTAFGRPVIDLSTNEPADPVDGASFPSLLQTTSVVETPIGERQLVNLNVSQFRDGDGAPGVGNRASVLVHRGPGLVHARVVRRRQRPDGGERGRRGRRCVDRLRHPRHRRRMDRAGRGHVRQRVVVAQRRPGSRCHRRRRPALAGWRHHPGDPEDRLVRPGRRHRRQRVGDVRQGSRIRLGDRGGRRSG